MVSPSMTRGQPYHGCVKVGATSGAGGVGPGEHRSSLSQAGLETLYRLHRGWIDPVQCRNVDADQVAEEDQPKHALETAVSLQLGPLGWGPRAVEQLGRELDPLADPGVLVRVLEEHAGQ